MRACWKIPTILLALWISAGPALCAAVSDPTAKKALRRLPKAEAQRLARIVAIGGTPVPESWHILSHDPGSETGVRERVIADGEMSDAAEVSEFARHLTEADVIGSRAVRTDTDHIFHIANRYALENDLLVASMNYTLEKNGLGEAVWRVDCVDDRGVVVGSLMIAADSGEVMDREGFPLEPTVTKPPQRKARNSASLKLSTDAEQFVGDEAGVEEDEEEQPAARVRSGSRESAGSASSKKSERSHGSRNARKARRANADDVARTVTRPVRRVLRRVLPF